MNVSSNNYVKWNKQDTQVRISRLSLIWEAQNTSDLKSKIKENRKHGYRAFANEKGAKSRRKRGEVGKRKNRN